LNTRRPAEYTRSAAPGVARRLMSAIGLAGR
jgi:hypothetical protein